MVNCSFQYIALTTHFIMIVLIYIFFKINNQIITLNKNSSTENLYRNTHGNFKSLPWNHCAVNQTNILFRNTYVSPNFSRQTSNHPAFNSDIHINFRKPCSKNKSSHDYISRPMILNLRWQALNAFVSHKSAPNII